MQALDHSMIFHRDRGHLHADRGGGALPDPQGRLILTIVWAGAIGGVVLNLAWPQMRPGLSWSLRI